MTDLLKTGAAWLAQRQAAQMAHTVTYTRGGVSAAVPAMIGLTTWADEDAPGVVQRVESRDFIIQVADLRLDGAAIEPAIGDRIAEGIGSDTVTFEVMAPPGEPAWRLTDQHAYQYRIHTKRVDTT